MKKPKLKAVYDKESQVLSWQLSNAKSVDSDIQANVVIDYAKSGKIVRINFYDFDFENFKSLKAPIKLFVSSLVQV